MASSKFFAVVFAGALVTGFARPTQAGPISACVDNGNGTQTCDVYETDALGDPSEHVFLDGIFAPDNNWLVSYDFIIDAGGSYDGTSSSVSDILVLHEETVELYSNDGSAGFQTLFAAALNLDPIDGNPLGPGQTFGLAINEILGPSGIRADGAIGVLFEDAFGFVSIPNVRFDSGQGDTINIHSDEVVNTEVPEPATLTLVGLGSLAAAIRRRRKATV